MSNLKKSQLNNPYNDDPVYYCKSCLSLHVLVVGEPEDDISVCGNCNRTDIGMTDISTWRQMWYNKYGKWPEE